MEIHLCIFFIRTQYACIYFRNRFKTFEVCIDYCDEVMKKEREMSSDPNGNTATTNAIAPDRGRFVILLINEK